MKHVFWASFFVQFTALNADLSKVYRSVSSAAGVSGFNVASVSFSDHTMGLL